jgi:hypothetical protein
VPTIGGGRECPARGWCWRESKESNKPHKPPGIYENGQFPALIDLKITKKAIFYLTL